MRYEDDVDKTMTQLTFVDASGEIGVLNWFAVHPTSMTFFNRLITGDNKGVASAILEKERGTTYADPEDFVAGFAQTNCGDVTPNLNLNNTGPGRDDFESTRIIAQRQVDVARALAAQRGERLAGPIDLRFRYVDFSNVEVADEFTGRGTQRTCPSAFGYAFAAGSTEDGGGHPLFREGMTESNPLIEGVLAAASPGPKPTPELRECHKPKAILFAPGAARPPMQEQVMPLGLVRIGPFVLIVGPCEYTTMTGRRIREAVARELDADPERVVLAGYSNEFGGYVTTFEEYQTQQYEGGHTIFGPWEEAAFRQEFVKLARAMRKGAPVESEVQPRDMRGEVPDTPIAGLDDLSPADANFGDVVEDAPERVARGETVHATFWTGNPNSGYARGDRYLAVQRLADGEWETIAGDEDVATRIRFVQTGKAPTEKPANPVLEAYQLNPRLKKYRPDPFHAVVSWEVDPAAAPGRYRLMHIGRCRREGRIERFEAVSREFEVE
jgi:neutral ceramidase